MNCTRFDIKIILLSLVLISFRTISFEQTNKADSFKNELKKFAAPDSNRFRTLIKYYAYLSDKSSTDTQLVLINEAIALADKLKDEEKKARALYYLAGILYTDNKYDSSIIVYQKTISFFRKKKIMDDVADLLNDIAMVYHTQGFYEDASDYYFKAIDLYDSLQMLKEKANTFNNLSILYAQQKMYDEAVKYQQQSLDIKIKMNYEAGIAASLGNLAGIYTLIGKYNESIVQLKKALQINQKNNNQILVASNNNNIGDNFIGLKKYDSAFYYYNASLTLSNKNNDKQNIAKSLWGLGSAHLQLHNYSLAEKELNNSLTLNNESKDPDELVKVYTSLTDLYKTTGDYKKAFYFSNLHLQLQDSVFNNEQAKKLLALRSRYEVNKKQKEIELLEENKKLQEATNKVQRLLLILIFIAFLFVATFVILLFRNNKIQKQKNKKIEEQKKHITEQADLLFELNDQKDQLFSVLAHDLRSPLSSVQSMIRVFNKQLFTEEQFEQHKQNLINQTKAILNVLEDLLQWYHSKEQGKSFEKSTFNLSTAVHENILLLHKNALTKNITIHNSVSSDIKITANYHQLSFVIRNLLSNAIKFTNENGAVTVSAVAETDKTTVAISDNGIGMDEKTIEKIFASSNTFSTTGTNGETGTGLGLRTCKEFIEKQGGIISVSSKPNEGSSFSFTIPL